MASDAGSKGSATLDRHVAGTTLQFTFDEGPTKGKTYEHVFDEDGTVEFREVKKDEQGARPSSGQETAKKGGQAGGDRPKYGVAHVADGVHVVSYRSGAGYTLTVALNDRDGSLHGFASNDKEWYPVHGSFERID